MDNTAAVSAEEATVSIEPAEMVSIRRSDLALIARGARLFAAVFDGDVRPDEIVDEAADVGLTVDVDAPEDAEADDDVDTYVVLSQDFQRALNEAEELAGILPEEGYPHA